jgi:hypothetical protein
VPFGTGGLVRLAHGSILYNKEFVNLSRLLGIDFFWSYKRNEQFKNGFDTFFSNSGSGLRKSTRSTVLSHSRYATAQCKKELNKK